MATAPLLFADSFASQDLSGYTAGPSIEVGTGRGGRNAMLYSTSPFAGTFTFPLLTSATRFIIGAAVRATGAGTIGAGGAWVDFYPTGAWVGTTSVGPFNAYIAQISAADFSVGWTHIALAVTRHASAGTIDVWINSNHVYSATGLNTTQFDYQPRLGVHNGTVRYCDLIIQTSSTNTDLPYGDLAVTGVLPTADGAHTEFTPSTGTAHWSLVDNAPPVDTSYVSGTAVGQRDTYVMGDLPASTISVAAVVAKYRAAKTDAGAGAVAPLLRISAVDYEGTGQNLSTTFQQYYQVYGVSPATGVAWTVAEVNGLEAGVERSA